MKKLVFTIVFFYFLYTNCDAQIVTIPDANFKAALVSNSSINTNADSEIQVGEAIAHSGSIGVPGLNISDLTGIEAFVNITELICSTNQLIQIDLSTNTALVTLECSNNQLTSLYLPSSAALTNLICHNNQLNNLDLSACGSLLALTCYDNLLDSLDLSANPLLTTLACQNNQLTLLKINACLNLSTLDCANNNLTALSVSANTALTFIGCANNQFTALDFSSNTLMNILVCAANQLAELNIKNGNNSNLLIFNATNNSNLLCIQVDDVTYMNTNWSSAKDATASYSTNCPPCTINIPDVNFKAALVANPNINTNGNTEIECAEAASYTGSIFVSSYSIADLTGIESFINLTQLQCDGNLLTSLDLNGCQALTEVWCDNNLLTSLNTSSNTALTLLECSYNQLANLDVSANTALITLYCDANLLNNLDIQFNTALEDFSCDDNQITNLDVSANTALITLECDDNLLTSMDVSANMALEDFDCALNLLTALDLSANPALYRLSCYNNQIVNLNLSSHPDLTRLNCHHNQLTSLNIQNGNNINLLAFNATFNPGLTCIQVDDTTYMNSTWAAFIDSGSAFNSNCNCILPAAAGLISGQISTSACTNQTGIVYNIDTIAGATAYIWNLPPLATIIGNTDTNIVTVNYSPYSTSGNITVAGINACGTGISSALAINYKPIPVAEICRATVDSASQKTLLEWQKPLETYVNGFVIYREIPNQSGNYSALDTVPDAVFSSYIDTSSNPALNPENYKIAVLDSCGNTGDISAPFQHQTIRLYGSIQTGGIAKLYWTDYIGINDSNRYFNLLRDTIGNGAFTDTLYTGILPASLMNGTDISSANYPLCRYVAEMVYESNCTPGLRALINKSTSRSNIKNKTALFDSSSVGINAISSENLSVKIYPNPAKNSLTLETASGIGKVGEVSLCDLAGRIILDYRFPVRKNKEVVTLDISSMKPGIYLIKIRDEAKIFYKKLVINN